MGAVSTMTPTPAKQPAFRAHKRGGQLRVRLDVERTFTLEEAARALARVKGVPSDRTGVRSLQTALHTAAERGDAGHKRASDDEDLVAVYRELLLKLRIFEEEDDSSQG